MAMIWDSIMIGVNNFLDYLRSLFFKKEMELSLIGLQNAGKTSLVNVIATGAFHEDMLPTVGFNMRKVTRGNVTIKLWDLGGQPRFSQACGKRLLPRPLAGGGVCGGRRRHGQSRRCKERAPGADDQTLPARHPLLVLGNKNDLPGALPPTELAQRLGLQDMKDREVCTYSISCKQQANIDKVLDWLTKHAKS
eukprot:jgi/Tetstr1/460372/TSEL_005671.t1